jgi:hypothetical protein
MWYICSSSLTLLAHDIIDASNQVYFASEAVDLLFLDPVFVTLFPYVYPENFVIYIMFSTTTDDMWSTCPAAINSIALYPGEKCQYDVPTSDVS